MSIMKKKRIIWGRRPVSEQQSWAYNHLQLSRNILGSCSLAGGGWSYDCCWSLSLNFQACFQAHLLSYLPQSCYILAWHLKYLRSRGSYFVAEEVPHCVGCTCSLRFSHMPSDLLHYIWVREGLSIFWLDFDRSFSQCWYLLHSRSHCWFYFWWSLWVLVLYWPKLPLWCW